METLIEVNGTPVNDRVLVLVDEKVSVSPGGILLPDTGKNKEAKGTVVAAGPGLLHLESGQRLPMSVKRGDRVIFGKFSGTEVKIDGKDFLCLRDEDIFVVLK